MAYELYLCLKKETYESKIPSALNSQLSWSIEDSTKPSNSNTKDDIKSWLDSKSISYSNSALKATLLELVENSGAMEDYIPTWKEAVFRSKLSPPRVSKSGDYIVIKGSFSILNGELSAVKDLGKDMNYPKNSILTKKEAQILVNGKDFI